MVLPHALRELVLLCLGSSLWFFLMLLENFSCWIFILLSGSFLCSQGVSLIVSWFLSVVLPQVLRKYFLLSLGSSHWFFVMLLESLSYYVLVPLSGSSSCSQGVSLIVSCFLSEALPHVLRVSPFESWFLTVFPLHAFMEFFLTLSFSDANPFFCTSWFGTMTAIFLYIFSWVSLLLEENLGIWSYLTL